MAWTDNACVTTSSLSGSIIKALALCRVGTRGKLLAVVLLAGCNVPSGAELVGHLDRLDLGTAWHLQFEEAVDAPCQLVTEDCPRAVRVYQVPVSEFSSTVPVLEAAGLETFPLSQRCIDNPDEGCRVQGWDDEVSIIFTVMALHGSDLEVQVKAGRPVGAPPSE